MCALPSSTSTLPNPPSGLRRSASGEAFWAVVPAGGAGTRL